MMRFGLLTLLFWGLACASSKSEPPQPKPPVYDKPYAQIIKETMSQHRREIENCYESELKRVPQLRGNLLLEVAVEVDGKVSAVELKKDSMGSTHVAQCITRKIQSWHFAAPPMGAVSFEVPLQFEQND